MTDSYVKFFLALHVHLSLCLSFMSIHIRDVGFLHMQYLYTKCTLEYHAHSAPEM